MYDIAIGTFAAKLYFTREQVLVRSSTHAYRLYGYGLSVLGESLSFAGFVMVPFGFDLQAGGSFLRYFDWINDKTVWQRHGI